MLLEGFKNSSGSPARSACKTAAIARVWASISRVRYINGYGSEYPRLDRLQSLDEYAKTQVSRSFKLAFAERLCLNLPRRLFARMTALWNGRIVYQRHWHCFFDELCREWELMALISMAIMIANVFILFAAKPAIPSLPIFAISISGVGIILSIALHRVHQRSGLATASDISAYISYAESHHGLRGLSIALALPRALTLWEVVIMQAILVVEIIAQNQGPTEWDKLCIVIVIPAVTILQALSFFQSSN